MPIVLSELWLMETGRFCRILPSGLKTKGLPCSATKDFVNVLTEPIYFTYTLTDRTSGKFEYALPDIGIKIRLPHHFSLSVSKSGNNCAGYCDKWRVEVVK